MLLLSLVVAFGSGVVSFLSPCTVPLLPAYVGVLSGGSRTAGAPVARQAAPVGVAGPVAAARTPVGVLAGTGGDPPGAARTAGPPPAAATAAAAGSGASPGSVPAPRSGAASGTSATLVQGSLLYVLGFTTVFVVLGVSAGSLGSAVRRVGGPVQRIGGGVVLLLAVALLADARLGWLSRLSSTGDRGRTRLARSSSRWAPLVLGVVFATAFTPCVGPFLGAVLALAAQSGGAARGGVLLGAYALGLGAPFVCAALGVAASPTLALRLNRAASRVSFIGAVLLVVLGVALLTGTYGRLAGTLVHPHLPV